MLCFSTVFYAGANVKPTHKGLDTGTSAALLHLP